MPEFDFMNLALVLGAVSLGLGGVYMAMSMLAPEMAEKAKRGIPTVIAGIILVGVAGFIIEAIS